MFRQMRRFKQQITDDECIEVLKSAPRGVMALHGDDGYPYAVPLNYIYIDGCLYFHSAKVGHKTDAFMKDSKVSFCVLDEGRKIGDDWPLHFKSVIVFGRLSKVEDIKEMREIVKTLGMKYANNEEYVEKEIMGNIDRVAILKLTVEHMTGKMVKES